MGRPMPYSGKKPYRSHVSTYPTWKRISWWVAIITFLFVLSIGIGAVLLTNERATIWGVPTSIVIDALRDETARNALLERDSRKLHDRLEVMGIEERIKAFYRPQIRNEVELDQYIHQLLYDRTGYVGDAYRVNAQGVLTLKQPAVVPDDFNEWFKLARQVGLVNSSLKQNGIQYVVSSGGAVVTYEELAAIFSLEELRELAKVK